MKKVLLISILALFFTGCYSTRIITPNGVEFAHKRPFWSTTQFKLVDVQRKSEDNFSLRVEGYQGEAVQGLAGLESIVSSAVTAGVKAASPLP